MRKLLLFLFAVIFLFGCDNKKKKAGVVEIGVILPLSGNVAFVGKPSQNAYELAVSEFNQNSNKKIKLLFQDSKAQPKEGINAFNKLAASNVKIILGPIASSVTLAIAPLANKKKIVVFSPSSSAAPITYSGDYIFRNELSDEYGAKEQARLAIEELGWKSISIIYINNDYGVGINNSFEKEFINLGGVIPNIESFASGSTNFRTQLLKIKTDKSKAIFVIAQNEYVNIIKQIKELDIEKEIYATPIFQDQSFIESLGDEASNGIYYTYYGIFDEKSERTNTIEFVDKYRAKYNTAPTYYSALAYDNINIMLKCLKNVDFDTQKVKDELYNIKDFNGVTGTISFDKNGDVKKEVLLKKVQNGKFIY